MRVYTQSNVNHTTPYRTGLNGCPVSPLNLWHTEFDTQQDDPCDSCEEELWNWTHYREMCDNCLMDRHSV